MYKPSPCAPFWYSHKFKRAGFTYKIGLNIHTGDTCWVFGGYPAGTNDITLARSGILWVLPIDEMIISDKGYPGEPDKIITPISDSNTNFK